MKILVAISKTPDTTSKITFKENNTQPDESSTQWIINPYDEWYSLVRAIEIKEKDPATIVHILTVGNAGSDPILRKALALGGDEAIRINSEAKDAFTIANEIANVAQAGAYDIIFTGKESIDFNGGSVGAILAELLQLPYLPLATKLELEGNNATITREIEGGEEKDAVATPFVIGCTKGMAEQRIPNMRGIMGARSKPLKVVEPTATESFTTIESFELPAAKDGVKLFEAGQEADLIKILHEVEKVL
ncbi:electron transfer flavoprotein subunit beta/FixA family protein [Rhizosphaericola mali]|uniref:Electron transfer flavoprotein subunit beta n=1 Tax=Rhizosphaericola mali TaxID=2545455 RepID=A0A5P2G4G8_9BACT|nr:electron transfer flavoprotein subunit beta/FixA family protein [Rhizosphaericola mali]QES90415.1 electron transfer flavoprotein subunit beta/FixA family protein [Rhizosphaericola mali]